MKLTHSRIEFLTPIIRNLARRFEPQAGAACGFTHEDLEQEAWLKLSNIAEPPQALDKPAQWFSTVVCRHFVNIVNKGKTRLHPTFYGELNGYDRPEEEPQTIPVNKAIRVQNAINGLPSPRQKDIVRARFGINQEAPETVPQIARRLNITPRMVQLELASARKDMLPALRPALS